MHKSLYPRDDIDMCQEKKAEEHSPVLKMGGCFNTKTQGLYEK